MAVLLCANLAGSVAILLALALRRPMRDRFGAHAAYLLWSIVPLSVVGALWPGQPPATPLTPIVLGAGAAAEWAAPVLTIPDAATLAALIWLAGAVVAAAVVGARQMRFMRALGRLQPGGEAVLLRSDRAGFGPAVIGVFRPRIVTSRDFDDRFSGAARQVVLAHERVHLERGDALVNAIATATQCLAWFNPLVHLATRRMRIDQELSCDAAVVARFPAARRLYAEALLETQLVSQALPLGCHWPAVGEHPLKERVAMLNATLPTAPRKVAGVSLVAALGLGAACAAWAADAPPSLVTQPVWTQKPTVQHIRLYYPAEAAQARSSGGAVILCSVAADGRLQGCGVVEETGAGFGQAALKMSAHFQMAGTSGDGKPTAGGQVRIPIHFAPL
jgi:TonB family protein